MDERTHLPFVGRVPAEAAAPEATPVSLASVGVMLAMLIVDFFTDSPFLEVALERSPGMEVVAEEQYYREDGARVIFWAEGGDFEDFEAGLEDDPTVTDVRRLAEIDARRMYRVVTTDVGDRVTTMDVWSEYDVVLLSARADAEGWSMRMRFPDRQTFDHYRRVHRERDLSFRLNAIYREAGPRANSPVEVSESQRTALLTAYELGYFEVPRTASQTDVADRLGISSQSVSERLRRGTARLVESSLITG